MPSRSLPSTTRRTRASKLSRERAPLEAKSHALTRRRLINILKQAGQPVPDELMKFGTTVKKKTHGTYGAFFKDVDMTKKPTKITFD